MTIEILYLDKWFPNISIIFLKDIFSIISEKNWSWILLYHIIYLLSPISEMDIRWLSRIKIFFSPFLLSFKFLFIIFPIRYNFFRNYFLIYLKKFWKDFFENIIGDILTKLSKRIFISIENKLATIASPPQKLNFHLFEFINQRKIFIFSIWFLLSFIYILRFAKEFLNKLISWYLGLICSILWSISSKMGLRL